MDSNYVSLRLVLLKAFFFIYFFIQDCFLTVNYVFVHYINFDIPFVYIILFHTFNTLFILFSYHNLLYRSPLYIKLIFQVNLWHGLLDVRPKFISIFASTIAQLSAWSTLFIHFFVPKYKYNFSKLISSLIPLSIIVLHGINLIQHDFTSTLIITNAVCLRTHLLQYGLPSLPDYFISSTMYTYTYTVNNRICSVQKLSDKRTYIMLKYNLQDFTFLIFCTDICLCKESNRNIVLSSYLLLSIQYTRKFMLMIITDK